MRYFFFFLIIWKGITRVPAPYGNLWHTVGHRRGLETTFRGPPRSHQVLKWRKNRKNWREPSVHGGLGPYRGWSLGLEGMGVGIGCWGGGVRGEGAGALRPWGLGPGGLGPGAGALGGTGWTLARSFVCSLVRSDGRMEIPPCVL